MRLVGCLLVLVLLAGACSDDDTAPGTTSSTSTGPTASPAPTASTSGGATATSSRAEEAWVPSLDDTWHWQLEGEINTGYDVDVYDIDLFDAPDEVIADLRSRGLRVVCYFSAGSWEEWREDADRFPTAAIGGTLDGWEDERWLDVTDPAVLAVMEQRMDLAAVKGCDGVEPDNVAGYDDDTGFGFDRDDQAAYNLALADAAHARGLMIGLKNALDLIEELEPSFDFAVNEQCWEYDECDAMRPFIDAGKPVFSAEYADRFVSDPSELCERAVAFGMRTLVLPLDLDDSFRIGCDDR